MLTETLLENSIVRAFNFIGFIDKKHSDSILQETIKKW